MCASVADESGSTDGLGLDGLCWVGMGWDGMAGLTLATEPRTAVGPGCTLNPLSEALRDVPCLAHAVLLLFTRWHCFLV